jgi:hypothetical protein
MRGAISAMRRIVSRGVALALGVLTRRFVFHLLAMMLDHAARGGSQHGMMSGDMADDTANGRSLQASFGVPNRG